MDLWLVGAGPHAREYARVLTEIGYPYRVISRGEKASSEFENLVGQAVTRGGVEKALERICAPTRAIVAVSFHELSRVAKALIHAGTTEILLEKPGALTFSEVSELSSLANERGASVWIAYNRRFYESTRVARELIASDGGPTSCNFEFTEWSHLIENMQLPEETMEAWVIANSSHVPDLAFHLIGNPLYWDAWSEGTLPWHQRSSRFRGAGVTDTGALFSYHANWSAPGRWGIEVLTKKRRLIFRPLESLEVLQQGTLSPERFPLNDELDKRFKPGLYRQTSAFLTGDRVFLCSLNAQVNALRVYSKMAGYL